MFSVISSRSSDFLRCGVASMFKPQSPSGNVAKSATSGEQEKKSPGLLERAWGGVKTAGYYSWGTVKETGSWVSDQSSYQLRYTAAFWQNQTFKHVFKSDMRVTPNEVTVSDGIGTLAMFALAPAALVGTGGIAGGGLVVGGTTVAGWKLALGGGLVLVAGCNNANEAIDALGQSASGKNFNVVPVSGMGAHLNDTLGGGVQPFEYSFDIVSNLLEDNVTSIMVSTGTQNGNPAIADIMYKGLTDCTESVVDNCRAESCRVNTAGAAVESNTQTGEQHVEVNDNNNITVYVNVLSTAMNGPRRVVVWNGGVVRTYDTVFEVNDTNKADGYTWFSINDPAANFDAGISKVLIMDTAPDMCSPDNFPASVIRETFKGVAGSPVLNWQLITVNGNGRQLKAKSDLPPAPKMFYEFIGVCSYITGKCAEAPLPNVPDPLNPGQFLQPYPDFDGLGGPHKFDIVKLSEIGSEANDFGYVEYNVYVRGATDYSNIIGPTFAPRSFNYLWAEVDGQ